MAGGRRPQRSGRWSLRQVSLAAGVSLATARAAVKSGHLDSANLNELDVLVLRVAAMLPALQPFGELRPANAPRSVPSRDLEAVRVVRETGGDLPSAATLLVTATGAKLLRTLAEVTAATFEAHGDAEPYLAIPVGKWAHELESTLSGVAA